MKENKLIAEFMGLLHVDDDKYMNNLREMKSNGIFFEQGYMTSELMYDTDWNWLMDVVDKIEGLNFSVEMNRQEEGDYQCLIVKKEIIVQTFSSNKMQSIYQAVVNFIKWYEQNSN
jgi:UDP-glucose 4-epimerase